jgi:tetratricopeptide (TPR) repeat protein
MIKKLALILALFISCASFAYSGKEENGHWVFTNKKAYLKYRSMEAVSDQFFDEGDWEKSIDVLNKIKKKYPKIYENYAKISYLRWSQAVECRVRKNTTNYKKYIDLALKEGNDYRWIMPFDPDRANIEGLVYAGEKQWQKQAKIMSEVLNSKYHGKPSLQTYALICVAYEKLGDKKNSIYWLEKAVKAYPSYMVGKKKLEALS